jgi:hypothetical protein
VHDVVHREIKENLATTNMKMLRKALRRRRADVFGRKSRSPAEYASPNEPLL